MTDQSPEAQIESINKAFETDFERFAPFIRLPATLTELDLEAARERERALDALRTHYLGKKSALQATKRLIGKIEPEKRAQFHQLVQSTEDRFEGMLDQVKVSLGNYIENERTARESIDVT